MDRSTNLIGSYVFKSKIAALVELAPHGPCSDALLQLADQVAQHIAAMAPESIDDLLSHPFVHDTTRTVGQILAANSVDIVRYVRWYVGDLDGGSGPSTPARAVA
jgi:translation elongation factor EF-Ts